MPFPSPADGSFGDNDGSFTLSRARVSIEAAHDYLNLLSDRQTLSTGFRASRGTIVWSWKYRLFRTPHRSGRTTCGAQRDQGEALTVKRAVLFRRWKGVWSNRFWFRLTSTAGALPRYTRNGA